MANDSDHGTCQATSQCHWRSRADVHNWLAKPLGVGPSPPPGRLFIQKTGRKNAKRLMVEQWGHTYIRNHQAPAEQEMTLRRWPVYILQGKVNPGYWDSMTPSFWSQNSVQILNSQLRELADMVLYVSRGMRPIHTGPWGAHVVLGVWIVNCVKVAHGVGGPLHHRYKWTCRKERRWAWRFWAWVLRQRGTSSFINPRTEGQVHTLEACGHTQSCYIHTHVAWHPLSNLFFRGPILLPQPHLWSWQGCLTWGREQKSIDIAGDTYKSWDTFKWVKVRARWPSAMAFAHLAQGL